MPQQQQLGTSKLPMVLAAVGGGPSRQLPGSMTRNSPPWLLLPLSEAPLKAPNSMQQQLRVRPKVQILVLLLLQL